MPAPQNFRTAFNGFHREDVVRYLEYLNSKHTAQVNQLTSEADFLRSKLESQQPAEDRQELVESLRAEVAALTKQLEEALAAKDALEQRLAAHSAEVPVPQAFVASHEQELEAYRRAERTERIARERAELVYHQVNGVLADATVKVDEVAAEVGTIADQVVLQLSQLQGAVSSSKQALKDAAATLYAIRPDNH